MFGASKSGSAALPSDPDFEYVTLLLDGNGTNGGQNNTFVDSSTNNFTITRNGNTTQGSFSPYGTLWSNYFNGSSYLQTPSNSAFNFSSTDCTIEFWYFGSGSGGLAIEWGTGASGDMQIEFSSGTVTFGPSGGASKTFFNIVANTWNHIAAVKTGTTYYLYINGTRNTTSSGTAASSATTVNIGGRSGGSVYITGYLSNLRITNNVVYTGTTLTVPTTPLTAISGTQLLTCQSNCFIDNSSNNFTLTVNGSPSVQRFSPFEPSAPYSTSVIGGSGYFDGSGDYLTVADNSAFDFGSGDFTIEMWYYPTAAVSTSLITKRSSNSSFAPFMIQTTTGKNLIAYLSTSGSSWAVNSTTTATFNLNAWNHIAMVRSGTGSNNLTLYLNGTSVATGSLSSTALMTNTAGVAIVADDTSGSLATISGYLANVRLVKGTAVYTATFTPPTAPLTAITNTSLLLNTTNASIADLAMQNNLETVGNAQVSTSVKKFGTGSLAFDGNGDFLSYPSSVFGSGNFTVEGWVYFNSTSGDQAIFGINFNSNANSVSAVRVDISSGVFRFMGSTDGTNFYFFETTSTSPSTSTWYHIALVRSSGTVTFYVNGTSAGSVSSVPNALYAGTGGSRIGNIVYSSNYYLNGYVDDFRITNGLARYTANFTAPTAPFPTY